MMAKGKGVYQKAGCEIQSAPVQAVEAGAEGKMTLDRDRKSVV